MGADLGFFAEDRERDFPELNKCPDCETFFADECCPLCGKACPEEFRAGNRKPIKQKKHRRASGNGRVQFVPWYHTVWFIVAMLIIQPIIGLILTWTGVWKTRWKVIVTLLVILPYVLLVGSGFIFAMIDSYSDPVIPVNLELSEPDYRAACAEPDAEALYRNSQDYVGNFVQMELTVAEVLSPYYFDSVGDYWEANVYLCQVQDGDITLEFVVVDYRQENLTRLAVGDKITAFGEVAGEVEVTLNNGNLFERTTVYARFIDLQ